VNTRLQFNGIEMWRQENGFKIILNRTALSPQPSTNGRGRNSRKTKPHPEGCGYFIITIFSDLLKACGDWILMYSENKSIILLMTAK